MAEIIITLANGQQVAATAQNIAKNIREASKELSKAKIGTEEWAVANKKLDEAVKTQADIQKQIKATTAASNSLKQTFGGILNQIPGFSALSGVLSSAKQGVGGLTSGFGLLKGAIAATGVGLLILAVGALVGWFTKTEKGANIVSGAFKGMGAVVDTLMNRLWNIGSTLKELFSNPVEFFKNLGKDITSASTEGYELVQVFDEIEDKQRAQSIRSKAEEIQIDRLLTQQKNVGKTYNERLAILAQVEKLTRDSYKDQLALSKLYLDTVNREVAAAQKKGTLGDELQDKQTDAYLAYLDLVAQEGAIDDKVANAREKLFDKQERELTKQTSLKEKDVKSTEEAAKEKLKLQEEYYAQLDELQKQQIEKMPEGRDRDLEMLNFSLQNQLEAIDSNAPLYAERMAAAAEQGRAKRKEINDKWDVSDLADKIIALDNELLTEQNIVSERLLAGQINEEQFRVQTADLVLQNSTDKLALLKAAHGEQSAEYQGAYANHLKIEQSAADASLAIQNDLNKKRNQAVVGGLGVLGNAFGAIAGLHEQGTKKYKQAATAQAIISTIQGAINAYTSTLAIPYVGSVLAPIAAGAALAAGYAQVNKIKQTDVKSPMKAESGGLLVGPRHSNGGIKLEAEGGEFIFSRKAVAGLGVDQLSHMNDHFTRKFETGGPVNPFGNSQPTSSTPSLVQNNNRGNIESSRMIESKLDTLIGVVTQWPTRLKVVNVVTETEDGIKAINKIRNDANV